VLSISQGFGDRAESQASQALQRRDRWYGKRQDKTTSLVQNSSGTERHTISPLRSATREPGVSSQMRDVRSTSISISTRQTGYSPQEQKAELAQQHHPPIAARLVFRCTPSIDRCTVYQPGPTWGRPVARRRQREISLSQMQTTAPCSGRREEGTSGFALQVLISGIDTCTPNTEAWTGQHCMRHTHHRQHHQQRHEEALQTRLSLPGPVHPIGDGRWLAPPQHACASERHQDSVDPV
jgi:hypothetical protein